MKRGVSTIFRIGEFSKLTQISVRMLRYYDESGLLKPAQIDQLSGYRYYSADQIPRLHQILFLRDAGFQVADIASILGRNERNYLLQELESKKEDLRNAIREQQEQIEKIEAAMEEMKDGRRAMAFNVILKQIPAYPVLSLRKIIPDYFSEGQLWKELSEIMERERYHIPQSALNFAVYHDVDFKERDVDVEVCAVVSDSEPFKESPLFRMTAAVRDMACMMVYGPFENIGPAFESFALWLSDNSQYQMTGRNRQICHRGPWNEKNSENYLTEIQIPIEKRS